MLRILENELDSWKPEEMFKEQLVFELADGTFTPIVHSQNKEPYYAFELAELYHKRKLEEKKVENITKNEKFQICQGHRKQMFTVEQKSLIFYKNKILNISKRQLAKEYHCSDATIRRIIKELS